MTGVAGNEIREVVTDMRIEDSRRDCEDFRFDPSAGQNQCRTLS